MLLGVILLCSATLIATLPHQGDYGVGTLSSFHAHKFKPETRIINGNDAVPHAYPYQVHLRSQKLLYSESCGGSLIKPDTVLTAAHCVKGSLWTEVTLGAHNISDASEPTQIRVWTILRTVHENWSRISLRNDIALVRLLYAVKLNKYIQTIKLASDPQESYDNSIARVTGWGKTSDYSQTSQILKVLDVRVLSNEECKSIVPFDTVLTNSHMCTDGTGNKGFCAGDSGGPLVSEEEQIGIVSFNYPSCEKSKPSVYTRLTSFAGWLKQHAGV